jgi:outer membrane protein TolC
VNAGLSMPSAYSQPGANDTDWSVALSATFTFFKGGEKYATYRKAREELEQYKTEYRLAMETLEERVRSALYQTNSSYPAIRLSRDAADAAEKNLKLVTDAYARGVVSIIELLDAQNASLVASQVAANAVYDFLIDLMTVHRAAGRFPFFMSQEEKEAWFLRLEGFF